MATLGPDLLKARELLEQRFLAWASECGAVRMLFPPLMKVADLERFDYFQNFPHLALLAAPLSDHSVNDASTHSAADGGVPGELLAASEYALASAACYPAYLSLRGMTLQSAQYITTVATCYRNEQTYQGLRRLRAFTMREIICVGPRNSVQAHLTAFKSEIPAFAGELGLELAICPANDPFFQRDGGRAAMQKLFPVKEEFVYGGSLAIASVNFHRNFFGQRCGIGLPDGGPAFTGCVAFGLERWLAALLETHVSAEAVLGVLSGAAK